MEKIKKKNIMKIAKIVFVILVTIFLIRYFYKNFNEYRELEVKLNWKILAISILFYFIYKISLASLWHYITKLNNSAIQYPKAITAYLYSILGKYIPGKVFMLLARVPPYEEEGIRMRKVTICFLLENICTLLSAAFIFLISIFCFPNDLLNDYKWLTVGLIILFFLCINPKIINFFMKYVEKITKKEDMMISINYTQMIKVVLLFICNWLVVGIGFYMLTCSIYSIPLSELVYVSGIYGLCCIIGILAFFAPAGIGVRESILLVGLSMIMPKEYAVIISIVSRLWQSVAELILIGIAFVVNQIKRTNSHEQLKITK